MRKRLIFMLFAVALAALVAAAGAMSTTLSAPDGNTQGLEVAIKPTKLFKKKPTPIKLEVVTTTGSTKDPNGKPIPVTEAVIDFAKGTAIESKGYPTCDVSQIEGVTATVANEVCRKAKIGGGHATVLLPSSKGASSEALEVTAFNGKPVGGNPVVLLHAFGLAPVQVTQVLVGTVTKYNKEGFGPRLTVPVPAIAGGSGALTEFTATIFKKYSFKGQQRSYVTATCPSKKLKARGKFTFKDGESLTPEVTGKCTQKPEPKKHKKHHKRRHHRG
jgi:hypothetical protein